MAQLESQDFYQKIEKAIETREFPNLLLFFGEEPYLIDQAVKYVKACVLEGGSVDFNWRSFEGSEAEATAIKDEVETLPMMASHRAVLVKDVSDFRDSEWATLMPVIENPVTSTVLMLTAGKLDKRKKAIQTLLNSSLHIEFKKPYDNQIAGWIRHIAKGLALEIESQALEVFHRKVGNSLIEIEGELRKLRSYLGERTEITLEDVEASVSDRREENIFSLAGVMAMGDQGGALIQAARLLEQGESEIGIVALTARHFRILSLVHLGMSQGLSCALGQSCASASVFFERLSTASESLDLEPD